MKRKRTNYRVKKKSSCCPDKSRLLYPKPCNYSKLNQNGFVDKDTYVDGNDILIGKVIPTKDNSKYDYKDNSTTLRRNESGYVDENYITTNGDGCRICKTRIRSFRFPEIGDKFSSVMGRREQLEWFII